MPSSDKTFYYPSTLDRECIDLERREAAVEAWRKKSEELA